MNKCVNNSFFLGVSSPHWTNHTVWELHHSSESNPPAHTKTRPPEPGLSCTLPLFPFPATLWVSTASAFILWVWKEKSRKVRCLIQGWYCWLARAGVQLNAFPVYDAALPKAVNAKPSHQNVRLFYFYFSHLRLSCLPVTYSRNLGLSWDSMFLPTAFYCQWNAKIRQLPLWEISNIPSLSLLQALLLFTPLPASSLSNCIARN